MPLSGSSSVKPLYLSDVPISQLFDAFGCKFLELGSKDRRRDYSNIGNTARLARAKIHLKKQRNQRQAREGAVPGASYLFRRFRDTRRGHKIEKASASEVNRRTALRLPWSTATLPDSKPPRSLGCCVSPPGALPWMAMAKP